MTPDDEIKRLKITVDSHMAHIAKLMSIKSGHSDHIARLMAKNKRQRETIENQRA